MTKRNLFTDHMDNVIPREHRNDIRQYFNMLNFSKLEDSNEYDFYYKVTFEHIIYIPPCSKYSPPKKVFFYKADGAESDLVNESVRIADIIAVDPAHFLSLHPVRYNRVKFEISEGEIPMPIMTLSEEYPTVFDGRHRIMALYKYGFTHVDVLLKAHQRDTIIQFLNRISTSALSTEATSNFISREEDKIYTLDDFEFSNTKV